VPGPGWIICSAEGVIPSTPSCRFDGIERARQLVQNPGTTRLIRMTTPTGWRSVIRASIRHPSERVISSKHCASRGARPARSASRGPEGGPSRRTHGSNGRPRSASKLGSSRSSLPPDHTGGRAATLLPGDIAMTGSASNRDGTEVIACPQAGRRWMGTYPGSQVPLGAPLIRCVVGPLVRSRGSWWGNAECSRRFPGRSGSRWMARRRGCGHSTVGSTARTLWPYKFSRRARMRVGRPRAAGMFTQGDTPGFRTGMYKIAGRIPFRPIKPKYATASESEPPGSQRWLGNQAVGDPHERTPVLVAP